MSPRPLLSGLRKLIRREDAYREVSDEVQHYLAEAAAAHEARGLTPQQALRAARLELGGSLAGVVDQVDSYGWENTIESIVTDVRNAHRRLIGEPVFAVVTISTLAIGVGAVTAMFSAVHGILLRPLPYPSPDRLVAVWDVAPDASPLAVTFGSFHELAARSETLDEAAVFAPWRPALSGVATPERLQGQRVSAAYFRVLGVAPLLGTGLSAAEDRPGGADQVVVSDGLWRRHFGADRAIVGRLITLDGRPFQVVGVMGPEFVNVPAAESEIWTLLQYDVSQGRAWGHHLQMIGRLRDGLTVVEAERELGGIASAPLPEMPRPAWAALENGLRVTSLHEDATAAVRPALLAMLGAAALLVAIAGANVTNLLIGHGARRREEFAVRMALGAGHGRLIRQLLTETVVIAALGGGAGIGVAFVGLRALLALSPSELPRLSDVSVDVPVLAVALGTTICVGLGAGWAAALHSARTGDERPSVAAARRAPAIVLQSRKVLVIAEVALVVVLLAASGLLLRSMNRLMAEDVGFTPAGRLALQVQVSGVGYNDDDAIDRFFVQALQAIEATPGVSRAAFTSQLPLSGDHDRYGLELVADLQARPDDDLGVFRYAVSPAYLEVMGIPLRRGRWFDESDATTSLRVAVISDLLARRRFPGVDPIGRQIRIGAPDRPAFTIVGVVGDVRQESLAVAPAEAVYVPAAQWHFADDARSFVVRADGASARPDALIPAIREAIGTVDPAQPIHRVTTMDALMSASAARRSFVLTLFEAFAIAALVLAAAGVYGVHAASVAERRSELGIRAALGAAPGRIMWRVIREGLTTSAWGIAIGTALALAQGRLLLSLLHEVSPFDPVTYFGVIGLVLSIGLIACTLPAWRAGRVDPVSVLKRR